MSQYLFTVGETQAVTFLESAAGADDIPAPTGVTATIRDSTTQAVVVAAAGGGVRVVTADREYEVYYGWAPVTEGKYDGHLSYTHGDAVKFRRFTATVLPAASKYFRWIEEIRGVVQEHAEGEDMALLPYDDYMRAADRAVLAYSRANPRLLRKLVTLTASDWTYLLSELVTGITPVAAWVEGLSEIRRIEYPVDATVQSRTVLGPLDWEVDERAGEWHFRYSSPSSGETAYVTWTALHTLTHAASTVPELDFQVVAKYAAGECLQMLGTRSIHLDAPQIAAEFAQSFQSRREQYAAQAKELMRAARQEWKRTVWAL